MAIKQLNVDLTDWHVQANCDLFTLSETIDELEEMRDLVARALFEDDRDLFQQAIASWTGEGEGHGGQAR